MILYNIMTRVCGGSFLPAIRHVLSSPPPQPCTPSSQPSLSKRLGARESKLFSLQPDVVVRTQTYDGAKHKLWSWSWSWSLAKDRRMLDVYSTTTHFPDFIFFPFWIKGAKLVEWGSLGSTMSPWTLVLVSPPPQPSHRHFRHSLHLLQARSNPTLHFDFIIAWTVNRFTFSFSLSLSISSFQLRLSYTTPPASSSIF